jgi:prepilin signal peptidase PulO-like enzyme (type II secretory pathway)
MEQIIGALISAIFGAIFGSYSTLFAYRLPLGESCFGRYFGPKSRCPKCGYVIKTRELIPLLNWLFTRGKCSSCGVKIPRSHLFIEASCTILFVLCYLKFGFSEFFIIYTLMACSCVILAVCDFKYQVFPFQVLIFLTILGVAARVLIDQSIIEMVFSIFYGAIASAIFYYLFYKKTSGIFANQSHFFDYVKFILITSIFLQNEQFFSYFLTLMIIFGSIILIDAVKKRKSFGYGFCLIWPFLWLLLT